MRLLSSGQNQTMRIGIDATAVLDEGTGLENHVMTLADALMRFTEHTVVAFVRHRPPESWAEAEAERLETVVLSVDSQVLATQWHLPRAASQARLDILYCGAKPAPATYTGRLMVGIHDPIPWTDPAVMGRGAAPWFRAFHSVSIRHGARICTPTEASRRALEVVLGLGPHRVSVIGNALAPGYDTLRRDPDLPRPSRAPDTPYFLAVGRSDPRRGLGTLLDAWDHVRREEPDLALVLVGKTGWKVGDLVERAHRTSGVHLVGEVPTPELAGFYRHARGFATASVHEGFGLTVLEAMSMGCPVVASAIPPHVEVAGASAVYFGPGDWQALARHLLWLARTDGGIQMREAGLLRASAFSAERLAYRWEESARLALSSAGR